MGESIADTSVIIEKVKNGEKILENITSFSIVEFPNIKYYSKFYGDVIFTAPDDYRKASKIQEELKKIGRPLSAIDLLIATICIRKRMVLQTKDEKLEVLKKVVPDLELKIV